MENIKIYAVLDKNNDVVSNCFMAGDDVSAGRFMVQNMKAIYKDVPDNLKKDYIERVQATAVVKLGEINPLNKTITSDYNVICDFIGFKFEEVENGKEAS